MGLSPRVGTVEQVLIGRLMVGWKFLVVPLEICWGWAHWESRKRFVVS